MGFNQTCEKESAKEMGRRVGEEKENGGEDSMPHWGD